MASQIETSIIILILSTLLVFSQWYYLRLIRQLTDKIMAGNYTNYAQAQAMVQDSKKPFTGEKIELTGEDELDELRRLNSMVAPPL